MPSTRLRVYQYLPRLKEQGFDTFVAPAIPEPAFSAMANRKSKWTRLLRYGGELLRTIKRAWMSRLYDVVFIQKGILSSNFIGADLLFPLANKRLIFDFDDAVFGTNVESFSTAPLNWLQDANQTIRLSKRCRAVIAGNDYLKAQALKHNPKTIVIPTAVDTERLYPLPKSPKKGRDIVIGWMGMPSTGFTYLSMIEGALQEVARRFSICFRIVTLLPPGQAYRIDGVKVMVETWSLDRENALLNSFDVAVAPLANDFWGKGKCSLKLLQYMAAGLPTISSRAGMNEEVIESGVEGFLASSPDEWVSCLSELASDKDLRQSMGERAREKVLKRYSLERTTGQLVDILREVAVS